MSGTGAVAGSLRLTQLGRGLERDALVLRAISAAIAIVICEDTPP